MKKLNTALILILTLFIVESCTGQSDMKKNETGQKGDVTVYYFHHTRRCAGCIAVENAAKDIVNELYGGKVKFVEHNLEKEEGKQKGKELGISGQTLAIVSGDLKIDITSEGFLHAQMNPDKLKAIIKEKIDPLL